MASVKVLGYEESPFVSRVLIALNLKSINYEISRETFGIKSELLLNSNPVHKKVPVLIHDNKPISESLVIVQFIDEQWRTGPSILPSDPYDRATARFWGAYIDDKVFPLLRDLRSAQGKQAKLEVADKLLEDLILAEDTFIKLSKGKNFFGGDEIGYLDIALGSILGWFKVNEKLNNVKLLDGTKIPNLVTWAERFLSHDAVKKAILETKELLEFAYKFLPGTKPQL